MKTQSSENTARAIADPNLFARDVRVGNRVQLRTGSRFTVAKIERRTHPIAGAVLTFTADNGFSASFKAYGKVAVIA